MSMDTPSPHGEGANSEVTPLVLEPASISAEADKPKVLSLYPVESDVEDYIERGDDSVDLRLVVNTPKLDYTARETAAAEWKQTLAAYVVSKDPGAISREMRERYGKLRNAINAGEFTAIDINRDDDPASK